MSITIRFYWVFKFESGKFFKDFTAHNLRKTNDMRQAKQHDAIDKSFKYKGFWLKVKESTKLTIDTFEENI